jgi:hypothetical protein
LSRNVRYLEPVNAKKTKSTATIKVYHPKYGHGVVEGFENNDGKQSAKIRFKTNKNILRRFTVTDDGIEGIEVL